VPRLSHPITQGVRLLQKRTALQAGLNAASTGLVSLLSGVFAALAARHLATSQFGTLQFGLSLLQLVALFFEFGLSLPAARLAAQSDAEARHRIVAAMLVAFAPLALAFSLFTFALSFTIDSWSHAHAGGALRATAVIAGVYPFQLVALQLCQGLDRLHVASITNLLGQLAALVGLVYVIASGSVLTVETALWLRSGGLLLGSIILILWLKPRFQRVGGELKAIVAQARNYGFAIYVGRLLSTATYNMDVLMIGILASAKSVGLYTLADALARLMVLPTIGATAALFPRMVRDDRIPRLWTRLSWAVGGAGLLGLILLGPLAINLVFSSRYRDATAFLVPLGAAEAIRGVTLVYNSFLGAQARGRELRNAGFILTGSNLILNFALIPPFGALGAAWASLAALVANLLAHVVYYRRALGPAQPPAGQNGPPVNT
jgi:O-antigen/teichoic acid export membrane protein